MLSDPAAEAYPWDPLSVATAAQKVAPPPIPPHEAKIIRLACANFAMKTVKEVSAARLDASYLVRSQDQIDKIRTLVLSMPGGAVFEPEGETPKLPPQLAADLSAALTPFPQFDLINGKGMDKYAGDLFQTKNSVLLNLLDLPISVNSISQAVDALIQCEKIVMSMLDRAQDGSTSSRLALQYQVIQYIADFFTLVLPLPKTFNAASGSMDPSTACIYLQPLDNKRQLNALKVVYHLALIYAQTWQAISAPNRSFDSERSLISACILVIFDAFIRTPALDEPLITTVLLREDNNYSLSTTVCQNSRPFDQVS